MLHYVAIRHDLIVAGKDDGGFNLSRTYWTILAIPIINRGRDDLHNDVRRQAQLTLQERSDEIRDLNVSLHVWG